MSRDKRREVVLGIRATVEQRAWMKARAEELGLSLQAYFEELMAREATSYSPWLKPNSEQIRVGHGALGRDLHLLLEKKLDADDGGPLMAMLFAQLEAYKPEKK